jgi:hypothetical protein
MLMKKVRKGVGYMYVKPAYNIAYPLEHCHRETQSRLEHIDIMDLRALV